MEIPAKGIIAGSIFNRLLLRNEKCALLERSLSVPAGTRLYLPLPGRRYEHIS